MQRWPLLAVSVAADLSGVLLAGWLTGCQAWLVLPGYLLATWFLGGHAFVRWPWLPYHRLMGRVALVMAATALWVSAMGGLIKACWLFVLLLSAWMLAMRWWLQPLARIQARQQLQASLLPKPLPGLELEASAAPVQRQLVLLLVAYHPSALEVQQLQTCLSALPAEVGYAVVVNDHQPGEAVEQLAECADCFLINSDNPGYGRAVNRLVRSLNPRPEYLGVLNTDLTWQPGTFSTLLHWLQEHPQVSLAVPQILDENGTPQKLCKHHPTLLGLLSRRFLPEAFKPQWLKRYDRWYVMADQDYQQVFDVPYLSGCCMLIKRKSFESVGGFDERYFLYLEDADITRSLAQHGRCVHLPVAGVVHGWGRGNYRNLRLMVVNLVSAWQYFRKWGWALF